MGIMMSLCDVTAHDSNGIEIPAKNTYPYSYSSLRDTLPHQSQTCPQVFRGWQKNVKKPYTVPVVSFDRNDPVRQDHYYVIQPTLLTRKWGIPSIIL